MLTDIFAFRYVDRVVWETFSKKEQRLVLQSFRIVSEQIAPYYDYKGNVSDYGKAFWKDIHGRLSTELGVKSLSPPAYAYPWTYNGIKTMRSGSYTLDTVCENWALAKPEIQEDIDAYMKERLSLVEIAFRKREDEIEVENAKLPEKIARETTRPRSSGLRLPGNPGDGLRALNRQKNKNFQEAVDELNTRFRQAGCKLHYHNGFIQFSEDDLILSEVEQPFWQLVTDPLWKNVDTDMKEAIDRRDTGGRDPTFYATQALESTIKIISDQKSWTHGNENGAHNYVDNLGKKTSGFIERWEVDSLKKFFTDVRNPFAHGPGSAEMPSLSPQQTDLAIEYCMSWVKSLIKRL